VSQEIREITISITEFVESEDLRFKDFKKISDYNYKICSLLRTLCIIINYSLCNSLAETKTKVTNSFYALTTLSFFVKDDLVPKQLPSSLLFVTLSTFAIIPAQ